MSTMNQLSLTPEQKAAAEKAGEAPVRLEDPETRDSYLLVREELYERLLRLVEVDRVDRSLYEFGEFRPYE